ncbi:MAG: hypothetical protein JKY60_18495 [Kordiimonadaceae bacterium]|nr:hypothetical protein [Kordiimonadaceae bacterium]
MKNIIVALLVVLFVSYHAAALQTGNDHGPLKVFKASNFARFCVPIGELEKLPATIPTTVARAYFLAARIPYSTLAQSKTLISLLEDLKKTYASETHSATDNRFYFGDALLKKIKSLREQIKSRKELKKGNSDQEAEYIELSQDKVFHKKIQLVVHSFHHWALTDGKAGKFPYQLKMAEGTSWPNLEEFLETTDSTTVMVAFISDSPKLIVTCAELQLSR